MDVYSVSFFKMAFQIGKKNIRRFLSLVLAGKHVWCFEVWDFTLAMDFHQWKARLRSPPRSAESGPSLPP